MNRVPGLLWCYVLLPNGNRTVYCFAPASQRPMHQQGYPLAYLAYCYSADCLGICNGLAPNSSISCFANKSKWTSRNSFCCVNENTYFYFKRFLLHCNCDSQFWIFCSINNSWYPYIKKNPLYPSTFSVNCHLADWRLTNCYGIEFSSTQCFINCFNKEMRKFHPLGSLVVPIDWWLFYYLNIYLVFWFSQTHIKIFQKF